jgi:hypothetical protein
MTIIGLTGYAMVGKDTVGQMLVQRGYTRVSFADAVRELARHVDPFVQGPVWTEDNTKVFPTGARLGTIVDALGWQQAKIGSGEIRRLLQHLGNGCRDILGDTVWIEAGMRLALAITEQGGNVVITDVRYPNEGAAIRRKGGAVIKIERAGRGPLNDHPSETEVARVKSDYLINNSFDLKTTESDLERILKIEASAR